ncbi:MAG: hypothetical protein A2W27_07540 [Deltaproteobacteria bacterium RBG_16_44_11]|jgi:hypothetical protein|nr:MAG: hypothetical protein A2W27_07540 [Deltaproteobacteria bacterium RBG_16_44_11]
MCALEVPITVQCKRPCKKLQRQGAQILRNEAYFHILRNDEGCRATQHMDSRALQGILRGRQ